MRFEICDMPNDSSGKKQLEDIDFLKETIPVLIRTSTELENSNRLLQAKVAGLEKELRRKNRLAVIGEMAACVAHEIRNPLATIELYSSMLQRRFAEDADSAGITDKIISAIHTLNAAVEDILSFAGEISPVFAECELNALITDALALAAENIRNKNIAVVAKFQEGGAGILADRFMLQRVFLNIILNAAQAVEKNGVITITTAVDNDKVSASFFDDGCGISADAFAGLFTPFFTNKSKGTGLGLAIAHRIVEAHKGTIEAGNNPGCGAVFTVQLPLKSLRRQDGK